MAALRCSRCGARIQVDGTSSCSCAPIAADDVVPATFEPFRPRPDAASSGRTVSATGGTGGPSAPGPARDGSGRPRVRRRGRSVAVGVAAAVTLGTVAFGLDSVGSGHDVRGSGRPAVSVSPDPDIVAREVAEDANRSTPDDPGAGSPSQSDDHGMWPMGEDPGEHPGPGPSAPQDEDPAPSPSGDEAGGASQGGGTADGGTSDGGTSGDPGGDDGGSGGGDDHESGGLLGGLLIGGLFGGGGGDDDHHEDGGQDSGEGHDDGPDGHDGGHGGGHGSH